MKKTMRIFRTVQEIAEWIDQNVHPDKIQESSLQSAIFFCAHTEAEQLGDMPSSEIARVFVTGGMPKFDEDYINKKWLPTLYGDIMLCFGKTELTDVPPCVDEEFARNICNAPDLEYDLIMDFDVG